ncbi:MAG: hypothetical protein QHJ81_01465 [Anaerolineae bacterium]|nr:hypothetical protein [Anaerolineae bacterium]
MAKKEDVKRRQKALERKAARRKEKRAASRPLLLNPRAMLKQAAHWPLHECLLSEGWQDEGKLVQVLVARRSPLGQVATGTFLVDLGCLGVKSAFASLFDSQQEYEQRLRRRLTEQMPMREADLNLVAKIIREGIAYAHRLGFKPDPDYRDAMIVLGEANPDACDVPIPLGGRDGKPFYIAGPYDNVPRIMAKLEKAFGPNGFTYLVPIGGDFELWDDE